MAVEEPGTCRIAAAQNIAQVVLLGILKDKALVQGIFGVQNPIHEAKHPQVLRASMPALRTEPHDVTAMHDAPQPQSDREGMVKVHSQTMYPLNRGPKTCHDQ